MSGTLPPLEAMSPGDDGPIVVVVAYVMLVFTILATATRGSIAIAKQRGFDFDQGFLLVAMVSARVQETYFATSDTDVLTATSRCRFLQLLRLL